ncbi:hypothetical protein TYRP_020306 [Tyrophagus putrescentiae]|nr:hypothetical protein TYRP_020306 [Tyrophagus putrescentiae]
MSVISTDGTLVPCPFDPHHKVSERRLKFHTIACASRRLGEFDTCKYNAAHFVPLGELEKHYTSCADFMAAIQHVKKTVVVDKQEEMPKEGKKKEAAVMVEKQRQQGPAMMKPLISFGDEEDILSTAIPPPPPPPPTQTEAQNRTFADDDGYFLDSFENSEHTRASRNFSSRTSNYSTFTKRSQRSISNSSSSTTTTSNPSNGHHHFENSPIDPPQPLTQPSPPSPPPQLPGAFAMPVTVVHPKFNVLTPVDWSRLSRKETFEPLTKFQVQTMTKGQRQRYHTLLIDWQKWKNRQAAAANNGQ